MAARKSSKSPKLRPTLEPSSDSSRPAVIQPIAKRKAEKRKEAESSRPAVIEPIAKRKADKRALPGSTRAPVVEPITKRKAETCKEADSSRPAVFEPIAKRKAEKRREPDSSRPPLIQTIAKRKAEKRKRLDSSSPPALQPVARLKAGKRNGAVAPTPAPLTTKTVAPGVARDVLRGLLQMCAAVATDQNQLEQASYEALVESLRVCLPDSGSSGGSEAGDADAVDVSQEIEDASRTEADSQNVEESTDLARQLELALRRSPRMRRAKARVVRIRTPNDLDRI